MFIKVTGTCSERIQRQALPHRFFSEFTGSFFQTRVSEMTLGFQKKVF